MVIIQLKWNKVILFQQSTLWYGAKYNIDIEFKYIGNSVLLDNVHVFCELKGPCAQTLTQFPSPTRAIILPKCQEELWYLCTAHHVVMENIHVKFVCVRVSNL